MLKGLMTMKIYIVRVARHLHLSSLAQDSILVILKYLHFHNGLLALNLYIIECKTIQ